MGIAPEDVTSMGLILACTHGGMVIKGRQNLKSMDREFGIASKLEHYGCMVDLLGRAGEVQKLMTPLYGADSVIWGAFWGACSFHCNVELAEKTAQSLLKLEQWNPANYVILSDIYASAGRWDRVVKLRKVMKGGKIIKATGYSFIEKEGQIHKFIVEDKSHSRSDQIYALLDGFYTRMKLYKECNLPGC